MNSNQPELPAKRWQYAGENLRRLISSSIYYGFAKVKGKQKSHSCRVVFKRRLSIRRPDNGGGRWACLLDFVLVDVGRELVEQAVGLFKFADVVGGQEWGEAFLPV